jgi:hypothetical protein
MVSSPAYLASLQLLDETSSRRREIYCDAIQRPLDATPQINRRCRQRIVILDPALDAW